MQVGQRDHVAAESRAGDLELLHLVDTREWTTGDNHVTWGKCRNLRVFERRLDVSCGCRIFEGVGEFRRPGRRTKTDRKMPVKRMTGHVDPLDLVGHLLEGQSERSSGRISGQLQQLLLVDPQVKTVCGQIGNGVDAVGRPVAKNSADGDFITFSEPRVDQLARVGGIGLATNTNRRDRHRLLRPVGPDVRRTGDRAGCPRARPCQASLVPVIVR